VPATSNPLGVKGCGEAGVTGALPAVMNAVVDALAERGVTHLDMPATPARIWQALRAAGAAAPRPMQQRKPAAGSRRRQQPVHA
jgi:carbon-monoxide dehydrogenase large subunit